EWPVSSRSTSPARAGAARAEREQSRKARVPQALKKAAEQVAPRRHRRSFSMSLRSLHVRQLALVGIAACTLSGCTSMAGPASAQSAGAPISAAEAQQGAQYHQQFLNEFGGAMTGPQAAYVEQVGKNIAVQSGLANSQSAFNVTLLNSSVDNAFAVPGGYVYVT